jgi:hypothetical protein
VSLKTALHLNQLGTLLKFWDDAKPESSIKRGCRNQQDFLATCLGVVCAQLLWYARSSCRRYESNENAQNDNTMLYNVIGKPEASSGVVAIDSCGRKCDSFSLHQTGHALTCFPKLPFLAQILLVFLFALKGSNMFMPIKTKAKS